MSRFTFAFASLIATTAAHAHPGHGVREIHTHAGMDPLSLLGLFAVAGLIAAYAARRGRDSSS